jgi:aromatic-L-amino-acid/L-tryptophan decarboxylase
VDGEYRMQPAALAAAIAEDRRNGWLPCCVAATVGSTSCTSIDPVNEIADICEHERVWLHVDAAYGGAAALLPEMRPLFAGWERADSITINPHKWLFVPLDCSVLFTRQRETLRRAFSLVPEYLRTTDDAENYMDYSVSLGRRFRALKLWFVLRYFGQEGLAARLREHLRLAQWFAGLVDAHPAFERLAPVPLSVVCFRAHPAGVDDEAALNELNEALMHAVNQTGDAFLTHTKLDGRFAMRMVISHLRTDEMHILRTWQIVQAQLERLGS